MIKWMLAALLSSVLAAAPSSAPMTDLPWQDAYAKLLRESGSTQFYLCDIDGDKVPELFVGGTPEDVKYSEYDVYTYDDNSVIHIGGLSTLASDTLELDHNHGVLSYDYGAGEGEMLRFYKDNHKLCEDGAVYGYYYTDDGQQRNWFRDKNGDKTILSQETGYEYRRLWGNPLTLECCKITDSNIEKVIYGWGENPAPTAAVS